MTKNYKVSHNQKLYFGNAKDTIFRHKFFSTLSDVLQNKDKLSKEDRFKKLKDLQQIAKENDWSSEFLDHVEFFNKRNKIKKYESYFKGSNK